MNGNYGWKCEVSNLYSVPPMPESNFSTTTSTAVSGTIWWRLILTFTTTTNNNFKGLLFNGRIWTETTKITEPQFHNIINHIDNTPIGSIHCTIPKRSQPIQNQSTFFLSALSLTLSLSLSLSHYFLFFSSASSFFSFAGCFLSTLCGGSSWPCRAWGGSAAGVWLK